MAVLGLRQTPEQTNTRSRYHSGSLSFTKLIEPICIYAGIFHPKTGVLRHHRLDEVLQAVLDILCDRLGFEFATVSLIDPDQKLIRTVAGRNAPWTADAYHSLESHDVQAEVLRHRRP